MKELPFTFSSSSDRNNPSKDSAMQSAKARWIPSVRAGSSLSVGGTLSSSVAITWRTKNYVKKLLVYINYGEKPSTPQSCYHRLHTTQRGNFIKANSNDGEHLFNSLKAR